MALLHDIRRILNSIPRLLVGSGLLQVPRDEPLGFLKTALGSETPNQYR